MMMTKMPELFCLICDIIIDNSSCINIFYTSLPRNKESLASFALRVLRPITVELGSSCICLQCYNLFQMLEQAQCTVANIHCEILKTYLRNKKKRISKQKSLYKKHEMIENINEQGYKTIIEEATNEEKSLKINDGINITSQSFSQDIISNDNFNIINIDALMDDDVTKVTKNPITKKKELKYFNKEDISCHGTENRINFIDSNLHAIDNNLKKVEEYSKSLNINVDILDYPIVLDNSTREKDHNINDNNSIQQQKNMLYVHQCKLCNKIFKSQNELHIHILDHKSSQEYQDSQSKIKFHDTSHLDNDKKHVATISNINIKDSNLSQDNIQKENLIQSRKISTNISETGIDNKYSLEKKDNNCDDINVSIQGETDCASISWKSGRILKYSLKPLKYSCTICGKKWKTSTELRTHTKTHSTLRPYMCEMCGQVYKHKHALEVHIGMHNGINPFQCSFCKKCFTQKGALIRHLPMHTGETPYQCELCGKRFVHHTSYNMHALSHTGKKSYQCNICDMSLLSTSHLKRHMRVHTGEKPYSCTLCGKRFAERYNLLAHYKIHDPAQITMKEIKKIQYKCKQCDLTFDKKQKLEVHIKCHYRLEENTEKKLIDCIFNINADSIELTDRYSLCIQTQDVNVKKINSRENGHDKTWIQDSRRLNNTDNETRLILSQNSLPHIDSSLTDTFNDQKSCIQDTDYNTNQQNSTEQNAINSNVNIS